MTYARAMNAALFLVFLERLLRSTTGKMFLMVDRLQAHQTPAVTAWVAAHSRPPGVVPLAASGAGAEPGRIPEQ